MILIIFECWYKMKSVTPIIKLLSTTIGFWNVNCIIHLQQGYCDGASQWHHICATSEHQNPHLLVHNSVYNCLSIIIQYLKFMSLLHQHHSILWHIQFLCTLSTLKLDLQILCSNTNLSRYLSNPDTFSTRLRPGQCSFRFTMILVNIEITIINHDNQWSIFRSKTVLINNHLNWLTVYHNEICFKCLHSCIKSLLKATYKYK